MTTSPHGQVPEAPTYERDRAIMGGERNASLTAFDHDGRLTLAEERLYEAAFTNGWDRHAAVVAPTSSPRSPANRVVAYSAATRLRELGFEWDATAEAWLQPAQVIRDCMTHVQKPAEIEHVAGDVSKNGPESNMAQQPAPSAAAVDEGFLRSVITLCNNRGASPESIENFDSDDRWIADLWRQAEQLIATTTQADSQPAPAVGTIAHVGTGKTTLTGAIASALRAARAPADSVLEDTARIEQIAQQWDGCMYDAVGETIDIGQAIRDAARKQGGAT